MAYKLKQTNDVTGGSRIKASEIHFSPVSYNQCPWDLECDSQDNFTSIKQKI